MKILFERFGFVLLVLNVSTVAKAEAAITHFDTVQGRPCFILPPTDNLNAMIGWAGFVRRNLRPTDNYGSWHRELVIEYRRRENVHRDYLNEMGQITASRDFTREVIVTPPSTFRSVSRCEGYETHTPSDSSDDAAYLNRDVRSQEATWRARMAINLCPPERP